MNFFFVIFIFDVWTNDLVFTESLVPIFHGGYPMRTLVTVLGFTLFSVCVGLPFKTTVNVPTLLSRKVTYYVSYDRTYTWTDS